MPKWVEGSKGKAGRPALKSEIRSLKSDNSGEAGRLLPRVVRETNPKLEAQMTKTLPQARRSVWDFGF